MNHLTQFKEDMNENNLRYKINQPYFQYEIDEICNLAVNNLSNTWNQNNSIYNYGLLNTIF